MKHATRDLQSLAQTESLGRELAVVLRGGDVVRLEGDLGAGKTTLTRSIAAALGANPELVSSPTYVFMNLYPTPEDKPEIVHLDCYRMGGPDDLDSIGWDAAMGDHAVALIEWPERIHESLEKEALTIRLEHAGTDAQDQARRVTVQLPESWQDRPGVAGLLATPRQDTTCPASGVSVPGDSPTWPFANERLQMADLYKWFSGQHTISRPMEERDLEEGLD